MALRLFDNLWRLTEVNLFYFFRFIIQDHRVKICALQLFLLSHNLYSSEQTKGYTAYARQADLFAQLDDDTKVQIEMTSNCVDIRDTAFTFHFGERDEMGEETDFLSSFNQTLVGGEGVVTDKSLNKVRDIDMIIVKECGK